MEKGLSLRDCLAIAAALRTFCRDVSAFSRKLPENDTELDEYFGQLFK
jgi:hypothetical protein